MKPFLRWADGKSRYVKKLCPLLPVQFNTYWEPFLGSGSVFFRLQPDRAYLSDNNKQLIYCYRQVCHSPRGVALELIKIEGGWHGAFHRESYYKSVRTAFNAAKDAESNMQAARMIFLNRTCYNAVWRTNQIGEFNVPFGRPDNLTLPTAAELEAYSEMLRPHEIQHLHWSKCSPQTGDLVYCDPPKYAFNEVPLLRKTLQWATNGVLVAISYHDDERIRQVYDGWNFHSLAAYRSGSRDPKSRGRKRQLLITNY